MQTALKILSERPELAKQLTPARQASSGAAELAERTADEAPKHSAPQPERSRLSRQVSSGAADQAEQASSEAAQHAGQSHPGPVVSRGVAGSRLAKETSAAEAMAAEAAMQAEAEPAEDAVGAPSSASAAAAPQADEEAAGADEFAGLLPREGLALEQVTGPARQLPPVEAEQPERAVSHVSAVPSPATEADSGATAVQQSQSVELALAEETAHSAFGQQPAQPNKMVLPKADDSAQLKEPSSVVCRSPGIAGDLSRKRERSMALEKLEEQEKPLRGSPARQGSILGTRQPSEAPESSAKLQSPLPDSLGRQDTDADATSSVPEAEPSQMPSTDAAVTSQPAATAQEATSTTSSNGSRTALLASAEGAAETAVLPRGTNAEAADAKSEPPEVAVSAAIERDTSSTAGTAAGPAVSVMPDGQRPLDASAVMQAAESDGPVGAADDGPAAAAHMQADAAHAWPAAASEAHSPTGSDPHRATGLHHSQTAPSETPPPADDVSPTEQPERQMPPSVEVAEGSSAISVPKAADEAMSKMASAELLCKEVLPDTPRQAPQQGIGNSQPSAAAAGPEMPGAQEHAADPAEARGTPQDSPNIAAALLQAGSSITVRASKHKRSAAGPPADVPPIAAEEPCKDQPSHTAVAAAPQTSASLGASASTDALKTAAQGLYGDAVPLATAEKATNAAEAVKPTAEGPPADALVAAWSADEEANKHDEACTTAPIAAESDSDEEPLRNIEPLTAALHAELDAAAVNAPDADTVGPTIIQK